MHRHCVVDAAMSAFALFLHNFRCRLSLHIRLWTPIADYFMDSPLQLLCHKQKSSRSQWLE